MKYSGQEIIQAAKDGNQEVISSALANHPDFFAIKDEKEMSLLQLATRSGHTGIVQLILEKKPNKIWGRTPNKDTLLHLAALSADAETYHYIKEIEAALLIEDEDAIPMGEFTNKDGQTVLHAAVVGGNLDIITSVYTQQPGLIDAQDITNSTPLKYALTDAKKSGKSSSDILNFFWNQKPELFKEPLVKQFLKWGETDYDGMLAGVAEKTSRKHAKGAPFDAIVIKPHEFEDFIISLKQRAERLGSLPNNIQFALDSGIQDHWIGGDIQIKDGKIDIQFFDSLADIKFIEPFVPIVRKYFHDAKIRMNFDKIQSGIRPDCAIMVLSNMFHMANMNQYLPEGITSTRDYLDTHIATQTDIEKIENQEVRDVLSNTLQKAALLGITVEKLPLRLIRDMESMSRILTRASEEPEETIQKTNQKGDTFLVSVNKHKQEVESRKRKDP